MVCVADGFVSAPLCRSRIQHRARQQQQQQQQTATRAIIAVSLLHCTRQNPTGLKHQRGFQVTRV